MNSQRSKLVRGKGKELEKIEESSQENDNEIQFASEGKKKVPTGSNGQRGEEEHQEADDSNEKDYQYEFIMSVLNPYKKVLYYLIRNGFIKERTPFCKHSIRSCYLNSLEGFCRSFFYGFMTKAVINVGLGMLSPKKKLIPNIVDLFSSDCMSFCTFLGAFSGIYKFMLCTLRRWRNKDDGINALISGAAAGFALMFEHSQRRRKFILLYLFVRALEALVNVIDKRKKIKIKYFECYMFGPLLSFLFYAYMYETECFPPGIDKAFLATSRPTIREFSMFEDIWQRQGKYLFPPAAKALKIK